MKPTTRLRILDHIRKHRTATVRELSNLTGSTGANIRHHLAMLELNDLTEVINQRKGGRGRPMKIYGLSQRMIRDGLDQLAGTLMDAWLGEVDEARLEAGLRAVAVRLAGEVDVEAPVMKRLVRTIERLNELHYQARWEASAAGARITFEQCPYLAIIANHPELCQMDGFLLQTRLGASVEQTAKLQLSDNGLHFCVFMLVGNG